MHGHAGWIDRLHGCNIARSTLGIPHTCTRATHWSARCAWARPLIGWAHCWYARDGAHVCARRVGERWKRQGKTGKANKPFESARRRVHERTFLSFISLLSIYRNSRQLWTLSRRRWWPWSLSRRTPWKSTFLLTYLQFSYQNSVISNYLTLKKKRTKSLINIAIVRRSMNTVTMSLDFHSQRSYFYITSTHLSVNAGSWEVIISKA